MKRSNEKGDQRREEAEADEESEEAGTWQAASKEELATRKIIKVNRKSTGSSGNISNPVPAASTTSNNFSNPFVGFSIPAAALSSVTKALEPASVNNPFAGFSFAKNDAPTLPTNPSISNSQASNSRGSSLPSAKSAISSSNETELMKKVRKLNESFLSWAERQMKEKAVAVWKDGVKDYIKYQSNLKEKYGNEATTQKEESRTTGTSSGSVGVIASEKEIKSDPPKPFSFSLPESAQKPATATILPPSAPLPVAPAPAAVSSTSLPSSAFSFSFKPLESSKKASEPAPVPVPAFATTPTTSNGFSFSFPSFPSTTTPSTTAASSNFSFPTSFGNNAEKKDTTSSSAFSFATTLPQTQVAADDGEGGGGDDDEGEPILPPEKILKNENDTDDILLEVPCKLFGFNLQEKEWKDSGKGSFRVTKDVNSGKRRMIVRNTMGKITFNAAFYKDMKIDQVKGGIKFFAVVADATDDKKTELKNFMIKLKDFDISRVKSFLESIIKEL